MHHPHLLSQIGNITSPFNVINAANPLKQSTNGSGLVAILNALFKMSIVLASVYVLFNLVFAGYGFISAGGDPKAIQKAGDRIWQSLMGLLIVAGSLVIAAIIGFLVFGAAGWDMLISPQVFAPTP
jgi:hypothetical protein